LKSCFKGIHVMVQNYTYVYLLSLVPGFEGRYALLTGPLLGLDLTDSFFIASIATLTLAFTIPLIFPFLDRVFSNPKLGVLNKLYQNYIMKIRLRAKSKEKFTFIGLVLFVAVPVPLTGVWTGSAVSYVLGLGKKSIPALAIGGLLSNLITYVLGHVYNLVF
jgi:uncharacterized membrane protein